jgi:hypothetical protein
LEKCKHLAKLRILNPRGKVSPQEFNQLSYTQWRIQDGDKGGLNNENLELELEINGDLRLSNRGLMKKSGSLGGL